MAIGGGLLFTGNRSVAALYDRRTFSSRGSDLGTIVDAWFFGPGPITAVGAFTTAAPTLAGSFSVLVSVAGAFLPSAPVLSGTFLAASLTVPNTRRTRTAPGRTTFTIAGRPHLTASNNRTKGAA